MEIENEAEYLEVSDIVDVVCSHCGIPTFRHNLNDEEIAKVCRWIGEHAPNTAAIDGKLVVNTDGFDTMIFIAITEFRRFYEKNQLAMLWRN